MSHSNRRSRRSAGEIPTSNNQERAQIEQQIDDLLEEARQARFKDPVRVPTIVDTALRQSERFDYAAGIVMSLIVICKLLLAEGDLEAAAERMNRATDIVCQYGLGTTYRAQIAYQQGMLATQTYNSKRSLAFFQEAIEYGTSAGDNATVIGALLQIASAHATHGTYATARRALDHAMSLSESIGDIGSLGIGHIYMADLHFDADDAEGSIHHALQAIDCFQRSERIVFLSMACTKLGIILLHFGMDGAEERLIKAIEIVGDKCTAEMICAPNAGLAWIAASRGDIQAFETYARTTEQLLQQVGRVQYKIFPNRYLGHSYELLGSHETAIEYYHIAEDYLKELDGATKENMFVYTRLAECYQAIGEPESSNSYAKLALDYLMTLSARNVADDLAQSTPQPVLYRQGTFSVTLPLSDLPAASGDVSSDAQTQPAIPSVSSGDYFEHHYMAVLSGEFPALTPMELKICSLLRLNMSCKEISEILNISVRTAETHRTNIRRKLSIPVGISLFAFLSTRRGS